MAELPRTKDGQVALPPTAAEMDREVPEQTVREQMAEALEAQEAYEQGIFKSKPLPSDALARVRRMRGAALDRHRTEPEEHCKSAGYLLPCDSSCPCYQAGTEAQRERVGGGTA